MMPTPRPVFCKQHPFVTLSCRNVQPRHQRACFVLRSVHVDEASAPPILTARQLRAQALANYKLSVPVSWPEYPDGATIVIEPIRVGWLQQTADLLTEAFVEAKGSPYNNYAKFLRQKISSYLEEHKSLIPKAVVLTAVVQPDIPHKDEADGEAISSSTSSNTANGSGDSREGSLRPHALVGTAEVSFDRETHSTYLTLNPPTKCAYLCNMAVSPKWQKRGVGKILMQAVEDVVRLGGEQDLYLHLRNKDKPATKLYLSTGFTEAAADNFLVLLLGQDMRRLMLKRVPEQP